MGNGCYEGTAPEHQQETW